MSVARPKILLLITPHPSLDYFEGYLTGQGYEVKTATNLREAISIISEQFPVYTLLSTTHLPLKATWIYDALTRLTQPILVAEKRNAKTIALTRELESAYFLDCPLEPLSFQQLTRKIERDKTRPESILDGSQELKVEKLRDNQVRVMSAMSELALQAIAETNPDPQTVSDRVNQVKRITTFQVQTSKVSGYFVLAYGQNRTLDKHITSKLQNHLKRFLLTFGQQPEFGPLDQIEIKEVDFTGWSRQQAEFVQQAALAESELVLAFFADPSPLQVAASSVKKNHLEVSLNHVPTDTMIDFDLYIYLPKNSRFVLYTPKGGTLFEAQKKKLLGEGVDKVHIHKRDLDGLRRQQTRTFLAERSLST